MKKLNRRFSVKETILIALLSIIVLGGIYYLAVYKPVKEGIETAHAERDAAEMQLNAASIKLSTLTQMQRNLENIKNGGFLGKMESYNNSKKEINYLNAALVNTTSYTVTFENITRNGDLIRRMIAIKYNVPTYAQARAVLSMLSNCPYRSLVTETSIISSEQKGDISQGEVSVNANITFFETMVGGKPDTGLPDDEAKDQQAVDQAEKEAEARGDAITNMTGIN